MAKIIKRGRYGTRIEYEESDPIYSEGWTIGPIAVRPRQAEQDTVSDKKNVEKEKPSDKQD